METPRRWHPLTPPRTSAAYWAERVVAHAVRGAQLFTAKLQEWEDFYDFATARTEPWAAETPYERHASQKTGARV